MSGKKRYTEPVLYTYNFDLKKAWFVAFRYTDLETGKAKQYQFRGEINKQTTKKERILEANALIFVLEEMLEKGWNPQTKITEHQETPKHTLIEALEFLIELRKNTIKKESTRTYTDVVKVFTKFLLAKGLSKIQPYQYTTSLAREYLDAGLTKGYSATTHNKHLSMLITMFNLMVDRDYLKVNPFKGIKSLRRDIGKNIAYTQLEKQELATLLKNQNQRLLLFVQFMYYCFLRRTEIYRLRVKDINVDEKTILIAFGSGKNRKQEGVSIPPAFIKDLEQLKLNLENPDHYVFSRGLNYGYELMKKADRISDLHRKYLRSLNISKEKTIYSWKHTGVIDLYKEIKDPYSLMRQLRHYDLQTTMIYLKSLGLQPNTPVLLSEISMF